MTSYPFEERVLGRIVNDKALKNNEKVFMQFEDKRIPYREMDEISNRVANRFKHMGIQKGDKVCLILKNSPEFIYIWFGLSKIGAIEVPINTALKGDLLTYIINDSDAKLAVVDDEFIDRLQFIESDLTKLQGIIIRGEGENRRVHMRIPCYSYSTFLEGSDVLDAPEIHPYDPIAIMYTSGTTGPSKGVVMPHRQFWDWGHDYATHMNITADDILYTCLPFFHGTSHFITTMMVLLFDATLAIGERFSASNFWDELARHNATWTPIVGAMAHILHAQPPKESDRNHGVKLIYSLPAPHEIYAEFEKRFNVKLIEAYGLTEVNLVFCNPLDSPRIGSCGKKVEKYDVRLVDECDREVPPGGIGEIAVRPKEPYSMMLEYYKKPSETLASWRNLWFHTGDLAYKDEEGYYYFVDRKKDSIRRKGENISSFDVEKVLNSHPKVLESAVFGIESRMSEQEIKACIRVKPGQVLSAEEMIIFCKDRLAYFMIPRFIEFKDDFPRTPNGKVEKYKLRTEGVGPETWDLEESDIKLER